MQPAGQDKQAGWLLTKAILPDRSPDETAVPCLQESSLPKAGAALLRCPCQLGVEFNAHRWCGMLHVQRVFVKKQDTYTNILLYDPSFL